MATTNVILKGKAKWAKLKALDKYGKWMVQLYPDDPSLAIIHEWLKKGLKNNLKKDEDGYYMVFGRYPTKDYGGKVRTFAPPIVLGPDNRPLEVPIGNGSDIQCKLETFSYRQNSGFAARLAAVKVDNLVPYELDRDFEEEEKEQVAGLPESTTTWS